MYLEDRTVSSLACSNLAVNQTNSSVFYSMSKENSFNETILNPQSFFIIPAGFLTVLVYGWKLTYQENRSYPLEMSGVYNPEMIP